jgi:hypothetical protein
MFEEVPRERRGVARLLARPVVLGPFVVGSGMLVAALGGSVAVATAATVITASAIGSTDLPARPGHPLAPATSSHQHTTAITRSSAHHAGTPSATPRPSPSDAAVAGPPGAGSAPVGNGVRTSSHKVPAGPQAAATRPSATPSSAAVSVPGSPVASPSRSGPLGNALVYFTGYDRASGRIAYQFATRQPDAASGAARYRVIDAATFTATLAKSVTITSGGTLCPPAGSSCTSNQLLNAAKYGFFAEVAIDAAGALRSVVEVGQPLAIAKGTPTASPSLDSGSPAPSTGRQLSPLSSSPTPATSPSPTS